MQHIAILKILFKDSMLEVHLFCGLEWRKVFSANAILLILKKCLSFRSTKRDKPVALYGQ